MAVPPSSGAASKAACFLAVKESSNGNVEAGPKLDEACLLALNMARVNSENKTQWRARGGVERHTHTPKGPSTDQGNKDLDVDRDHSPIRCDTC